MDVTKLWDYRIVRREEYRPSEHNSVGGSDEWYSIQEVYYDEDGTPMAQTLDLQVEQDTITGMRTQLENMLKALDEPVLDESDIVDNPVNTKTIEDRVLGLEIENEELRDKLSKLGDEFSGKIRENLKNLKTGRKTVLENATDEDIDQWKRDVLKRGGI